LALQLGEVALLLRELSGATCRLELGLLGLRNTNLRIEVRTIRPLTTPLFGDSTACRRIAAMGAAYVPHAAPLPGSRHCDILAARQLMTLMSRSLSSAAACALVLAVVGRPASAQSPASGR